MKGHNQSPHPNDSHILGLEVHELHVLPFCILRRTHHRLQPFPAFDIHLHSDHTMSYLLESLGVVYLVGSSPP